MARLTIDNSINLTREYAWIFATVPTVELFAFQTGPPAFSLQIEISQYRLHHVTCSNQSQVLYPGRIEILSVGFCGGRNTEVLGEKPSE